VSVFGNAVNVFRGEGLYAVLARGVRRALPYTATRPSLVSYDDALFADWSTPHPAVVTPRAVAASRPVIAWVMSPPGANSGGHQNIFRFIRFLERAGYEARIYLYATFDDQPPEEVRRRVTASASYATIAASIERYPVDGVPKDVDAIMATSWETAYRSLRDSSSARRLYFVQDFEPQFFPTGSESQLAENTYRFGFTGITAGRWLAERLNREFGMTTHSFDFGVDSEHYSIQNTGTRDAVFFYARPETPRRGFELGAMALDLFTRARPHYRVILAGQNLSRLDLPFQHTSVGNLPVSELNAIYNRCAAGLVMSLTNMSLLPLELLAAGTIPVVNDAPNNRMVSDNPFISFAAPNPTALAQALIEAVDRKDTATRAANSVADSTWDRSGEQFLDAVRRSLA
jgi:glycosyltransferase involved in cell wall biosynthesis